MYHFNTIDYSKKCLLNQTTSKTRKQYWFALYLFLVGISQSTFAQFEAYPPGFGQVLVTDRLNYPTAVAFAPDGRIFVAEQGGKLRIIKNDTLLPAPFVELYVYAGGEAGLSGIVLDPDFTTNQYIYLYHTVYGSETSPYHNRITRFTANGDVAVTGSDTVILTLDPLSYAEQHNGGTMRFGQDGKLYVGVGDSRNPDNAQNLDTYLGKILRINANGSVPAGNPFSTGSDQKKRLWAYGLRNPYSFSFQPETGRLFINDVGEGSWEEINDATTSGKNFGWPIVEGISGNPAYTDPIFAYDHTAAKCAITGGVFFNPQTTTYPASYVGNYFFQDYCTSAISTLNLSGSTGISSLFSQHLPGLPVNLNVGQDGNLYFLSRNNNALYRIIYTTNSAPEITDQPKSTTVAQGNLARFSVTTTGSSLLSFKWKKNGATIEGAIGPVYLISNTAPADTGQYCVVVSNSLGTVTSNTVTLSVTVPNRLPSVTITSPISHTLYRGGDIIPFSGTAVDAEDGILPASAFVWTVQFHHNTHFHDGPPIAVGIRNGQFTIPNQGETAADVFYRFILTVADSRGGVSQDSVDVNPHLVTVSLTTNRAGLSLNLNGPPVTTPFSRTFVSGIKTSLKAPESQTLNGVTYQFIRWQNGPDSTGSITIPNTSVSYVATYALQLCSVPDSLTTSVITDQSASLNWHSDGYTDETRYEIHWRPTGTTSWTTVSTLTANSGTGAYSLTGLTSSTDYEWQLKTLCSPTNSSTFSELVTFQTFNTCHTLKSGSWQDPTVWSCNRVPTSSDVVHLRHNVSILTNYVAHARHVVYDIPVMLAWASGARLLFGY